MRSTLDPKLDIVFKLLFGEERNKPLLLSFLNAVLQPASAIETVEVLQPEPVKTAVGDKGIVLDLRIGLAGGEQVDIEMQSQPRPVLRERALYYWARMYAGQLGRGEQYEKLRRCIVVLIANFQVLQGDRFHSRFCVLDPRDLRQLTEHLELHLLELPKLGEAARRNDERALVLWGTFLSARTDHDLEALAMLDPVLKQAKEALDRLSADPKARLLAEQQEMAELSQKLYLTASHDEGLIKGLAEGLTKGNLAALLVVLDARQLALTAEQRRRIESCTDLTTLQRWLGRAALADKVEDIFV